MNPQPLPALSSGDPGVWDQALYAFLVEKGNRSGSTRTVESYSRLLWPFFHGRSPDTVRPPDVLAYAHGIGLSGRPPSAATIGARIAALSSFYRFLIRMGLLASNPCDAVERPRTTQAPARGLSAEQVRRLLEVVPDTVAGRRDRAILLTFILTGRRRTEVISLTAADISIGVDVAFYSYRGKGGKRGRRELPRPAFDALVASLADVGLSLEGMDPATTLWHGGSAGSRLSAASFYGRFQRYLRVAAIPRTGLHVLRHSAAKLRRDVGESIEAVSSFLDHSSLSVTTTYLRRLEGARPTPPGGTWLWRSACSPVLLAGSRWQDDPRGLVFTTTLGTPMDGIAVTRRFQAILRAAGIRHQRFHDLRHACASLLLAQGVAPRVVMETLGHSQISLTLNTYSHVIPALGRAAADEMDAVLGAPRPDLAAG